ncbi:MAG: hypothetical protein J4G04_04580, partial [Nitrosopumilaceae archaeon]|nr:hypothetical protein [Nitrosopumilaceae archaeon]
VGVIPVIVLHQTLILAPRHTHFRLLDHHLLQLRHVYQTAHNVVYHGVFMARIPVSVSRPEYLYPAYGVLDIDSDIGTHLAAFFFFAGGTFAEFPL